MAPSRQLANLFYDLRARTSGLQSDLKAAETQFGKLSDFVKANPVAAISALGVAVAGVALKAAKMASEVETSLRRVGNSIPNGIAGLDKLRAGIESVSAATGKSQAELARNLQEIAKAGVEGPEQAVQRLKAIQTAVDATGTEFSTVVEGIDQTLDLFGGSSADAARSLGTLFAAAKGHTSLDELFTALQGAAIPIQNLHLDLDTAARALVALGEKGDSPKKAAAQLAAFAEQGAAGRAEVVKLAASIQPLADGFADMSKAADEFNNSAEQLNKRALADFASVMIDLGRAILPTVTSELRGILDLIERITGAKAKRVKEQGLGDLGSQVADAVVVDQTELLGRRSGEFVLAAKKLAAQMAQGQTDIIATTADGVKAVADGVRRLQAVGLLKAEEAEALLKSLATLSAKTQQATKPTTDLVAGRSGPSAEELKKQGDAAKAASKDIADLQARITDLGSAESIASGQTSLSAKAFADLFARILEAKKTFPQFSASLDDMLKHLVTLRQAASQAEIAEFQKAIDDFSTKHFGTALEQAGQLFDELIAKLEHSGHSDAFQAEIERLKLLRGTTIESTHALESLEEQFKALRANSAAGLGVVDPQEIQQLLRMADAVRLIAENENTANDVREKAKRLLGEMDDEVKALGNDLFKIPDKTKKVNEGLSATHRNLLEAADAAVALANAMGLVGDETASALAATIQLATSIAEAVASRGKQGIPGIISSVLKLGQIAFGKDPAAQQRSKELQENTEALKKLTQKAGDAVGLDVSGRTFGQISAGIGALLAATGSAGGFRRFGDAGPLRDLDPKKFLEKLGLDFADVQKIADQFGITLNGTKQSWQDLLNAMRKADFKAFTDSFAGSLAALEEQFTLFEVTDPGDQFAALIKLLNDPVKGAPALFGALEGIDTKTDEGRAKAKKAIQDLFQKLLDGSLDPDALNGLNLDQFREILDQLFGLLGDTIVQSLSDQLNDAFADIDLDLAIAGDKNPITRALKEMAAAAAADPRFQGLLGFDLNNAEGRKQAESFLQSLAIGADPEFKKIILELLSAIRDIPDAVDPTKGPDGESVIVSNAARGLTETTGNRMADYLATANIVAREEVALLTEIRDNTGGPAISPPVNVPAASTTVNVAPAVAPAVNVSPVVVEAPSVTVEATAASPTVKLAAPVVNVDVDSPNVNVQSPSVTVPTPVVNVAAPVVRVESPVVNADTPVVNVPAPNVTIEAPNLTVQATAASPAVNVAAPVVQPAAVTVESPKVTVNAPAVSVEAPEVNVAAPAVRVTAEAPAVTVEAPVVNVNATAAAPAAPVVPAATVVLKSPAPIVLKAPAPVVTVNATAASPVVNVRTDPIVKKLEALRALMSSIVVQPQAPPVRPPSFSGSLGAGASVQSSGGVSLSVGDIVVNVPPGVITDQRGLQDFLAGQLPTVFIRKVDEGLARLSRGNAAAAGRVVA